MQKVSNTGEWMEHATRSPHGPEEQGRIAPVGGKAPGLSGHLDGLPHLWPTKGFKRNAARDAAIFSTRNLTGKSNEALGYILLGSS